VNTRTTTLTTVPHASFALRFSDLAEVESAVHEDEEQRAGRTLDWIGSRIAAQSARWVEMVESSSTRPDDPWRNRTPWWDEVKRCIQGDNVPNRVEGWNHPVSSACSHPFRFLRRKANIQVIMKLYVPFLLLQRILCKHCKTCILALQIFHRGLTMRTYGIH
jgi:hypothetical protein